MIRVFMISEHKSIFNIPKYIFSVAQDDNRSDDELYCVWFKRCNRKSNKTDQEILDDSEHYWVSEKIEEI